VKKIRKTGPADPEIIGLQEIVRKKRNKFTQAKHIAHQASLAGRLNYLTQQISHN